MKLTRHLLLTVSLSLSLCASGAHAQSIGNLLNWARLPVGVPVPSIGGLHIGGTSSQRVPQQQQGPRYQSLALGHQAYDLDQAGQHEQARELLMQAVQLDPSNEVAWGNLMHETAMLGLLQETVQVGQQYLQLHPHGSQYTRVTGMLTNAQAELAREGKIAQTLGPSTDADYLSMTSENGVLKHWPFQPTPISVYIEDGSGVKGYSSTFTATMIDSFKEWSNATNNRLVFQPVSSPEQAQIVCSWVDAQEKFPSDFKYGECGFSSPRFHQDGSIIGSHIWILTMNKTLKRPYSNSAVRGVCLHEIGHTLGLIGHSDKAGDIMYFMGDNEPVTEPHLSYRDINTINRLYELSATGATMLAQTAQQRMQASQPFMAPVSSSEAAMPPSMMPNQGMSPAMFNNNYSSAPAGMWAGSPMPAMTAGSMMPSYQGTFASAPMNQPPAMAAAPALPAPPAMSLQSPPQPAHTAKAHAGAKSTVAGASHSAGAATYMQVEHYSTTSQTFPSAKAAVDYFEVCANSTPNASAVLDDLGSAYNNRAIELAAAGDLDGAHTELERAIAIHRNSFDRPRLDASISNYMMLLVKQGRLSEAQKVYNSYRQGNLAFYNTNSVH
jgi:predicted Zn-dependent protease/Tfp pilus assembly protein PilF